MRRRRRRRRLQSGGGGCSSASVYRCENSATVFAFAAAPLSRSPLLFILRSLRVARSISISLASLISSAHLIQRETALILLPDFSPPSHHAISGFKLMLRGSWTNFLKFSVSALFANKSSGAKSSPLFACLSALLLLLLLPCRLACASPAPAITRHYQF